VLKVAIVPNDAKYNTLIQHFHHSYFRRIFGHKPINNKRTPAIKTGKRFIEKGFSFLPYFFNKTAKCLHNST
jgi:hypothetical protein